MSLETETSGVQTLPNNHRWAESKREAQRAAALDFTNAPVLLAKIAVRARAHACTISRIAKQPTAHWPFNGFYAQQLSVNGHVCRVRFSSRKFKPHEYGDALYARMNMTRAHLARSYAHIFHISVDGFPERFLVIPSEDLSVYFPEGNGEHNNIYIPLERYDHVSTPARISFHHYDDAWELLKAEAS